MKALKVFLSKDGECKKIECPNIEGEVRPGFCNDVTSPHQALPCTHFKRYNCIGNDFFVECNYDSLKDRILNIIRQKHSYLFTTELIMKEIDNYNKENDKDKKDEDENEGETIIIHKT